MQPRLFVLIGLFLGLTAFGGCVSIPKRVEITAENNPTTVAGRGAPSVDDAFRPCAWVYVDGHAGTFREQDGRPLVQWFVDEPVRPTPTFRVESFSPLLGPEIDFQCAFKRTDDGDSASPTYAFRSQPGRFKAGQEYSLLRPGPDFVLRVAGTETILTRIDPLPDGQYALLGSVKSRSSGDEVAVVTYFTVDGSKATRKK